MGKGGGGAAQITGYRYYFDILMGVCRGPVDQLVAIRVGNIECWPGFPDGTHSPAPTAATQQLFNPGSLPPTGGFEDSSGTPVYDTARFAINRPNLFGGDKGEGGIIGNCIMLMGNAVQLVPGDVKGSIASGNSGYAYTYQGGVGRDVSGLDANGNAVYGNDGGTGSTTEQLDQISDFRGVAGLWYSGQVCSNNPYPKVWKIRVRRALQGWDSGGCWYPAKAQISIAANSVQGMNGAHIIYECLTNKSWGRGMDRAEMDDASFTYAANCLWNEGFALCLKWSKDMDISQFIQEVVNHISAALIIDRGTGLMKIHLIRNDYDPALVPVFTYSSGLLSLTSSDTGASSVLVNEIIVKWHDPILDQDRQVRVQDLAAIQSTGATISETKSYPGVPHLDIARRVGLRDLKNYSGALKRFKVVLDRRAWKMFPGSVMNISAPDKGIENMIVRVMTYDDGTILDGKITLDCVQDVFSMPSTTYVGGVESAWQGPNSAKAYPPQSQLAYEATYYDQQRGLTAANAAEVTSLEGGVVVLSGRPSGNTLSSVITASPDGGQAQVVGSGTFTPVGFVAGFIDYYTTNLTLAAGTDLGYVTSGISAVLGDVNPEFVRVDSFNVATGALVIARGCVDTIPRQHPANTKIYFNDVIKSGHTGVYAVGESVAVQTLTRTTGDILDPGSASTSTVLITGRASMPYPPGLVQINGQPALVAAGTFVSGNVVLTWASRNKIIEADQLVDQLAASITPEAMTTYTVQIRDFASGALLREHAGLTATTFTYTDAEADSNGDPIELDIALFVVVNGIASRDTYHLHVTHVDAGAGGYGSAYGFYYGSPP